MKKILFLALVIALCFCLSPVYAQDDQPTVYTSGDYQYILLPDGSAEIKKYSGKAKELTIPSSLDGYPVTSIGNSAFYFCDFITFVSIPDSITSIGTDIFTGCYKLSFINVSPDHPCLATIDGVLFNKQTKELIRYPSSKCDEYYCIPQGILSIGDSAFFDCDYLSSVSIPSSVTTINHYAFFGCSSLSSISIPNSVTFLGSHAFYNCATLTSISLPDSIAVIRENTFSKCMSLASISITDNITLIYYNAFSQCTSLTSVYIPNSVTFMWGDTFTGCPQNLVITVERNSYAANWCEENGFNYTYPDANDWLLN